MTDVNQLVTRHLDVWTSAIEKKSSAGRGNGGGVSLYGVKKLRELILELAVRGKLVPQLGDIEEGDRLFAKIKATQARLYRAKAIKKPKVLPDPEGIELGYDLPPGWAVCRLNDLGDWGAGATPSRKSSGLYGGGIPWFKSGELSADFIDTSEETVTQEALKKSSLRLNQPGDVLVAMYGATIGKTAILNVEATTNQAVCACTPFDGFLNKYLLLLLKAYKSRLVGMGAGGAQPNISREKIIATVVALPPTDEQHRIVAKVDELMVLCDALERQAEESLTAHQTLVETCLATLTNSETPEELTQNWTRIESHFDTLFTTEESVTLIEKAILELGVSGKLVAQLPNQDQDSFLDNVQRRKAQLVKQKKAVKPKKLPEIADQFRPKNLPPGWVTCQLQELIVSMDAGWSPACPPEPSPADDVWGVQKTTAVQPMLYWDHENKMLSEKLEPRPQYEVRSGDILITRAGPKNRVAICCAVQSTRPQLMISDKIIRFHLVERLLSSRFIAMALNAGNTAAYLEDAKSGMAESQMNISQDKLKAAPISLPPLEEQERIVSKVDELLAACDVLRGRLPALNELQTNLADTLTSKIH